MLTPYSWVFICYHPNYSWVFICFSPNYSWVLICFSPIYSWVFIGYSLQKEAAHMAKQRKVDAAAEVKAQVGVGVVELHKTHFFRLCIIPFMIPYPNLVFSPSNTQLFYFF
jgi:hypothetical protein